MGQRLQHTTCVPSRCLLVFERTSLPGPCSKAVLSCYVKRWLVAIPSILSPTTLCPLLHLILSVLQSSLCLRCLCPCLSCTPAAAITLFEVFMHILEDHPTAEHMPTVWSAIPTIIEDILK
jgi:hypothetical protein